MSLQRDRRMENLEKIETKKKQTNSGYKDNNITVHINLGSEDKISNSNNETKLTQQIPKESPEDKKIISETDNKLKELKGLIAVFNQKKQALMNNKIDIPNNIFDLPPIEIKKKEDIINLMDVIKDKINQLDKVLQKPITPIRPLEPSMSSIPSYASRASPYGFQLPPQMTQPALPTRVPPSTLPVGEKPTDIKGPVRDYDNEAKVLYENFKKESSQILGTSNLRDTEILAGKSNNVISQLQELRKSEPTQEGKNVIDNYIVLTQNLRTDLNNQYGNLIKAQQVPEKPIPIPSGRPDENPPEGTPTPTSGRPDENPPEGTPTPTPEQPPTQPPTQDLQTKFNELQKIYNKDIQSSDKDTLLLLRTRVADLIREARDKNNENLFNQLVSLNDNIVEKLEALDKPISIPTSIDKTVISQRINTLNSYKNNILGTGRHPQAIKLIEKQINDVLEKLNLAFNKQDLTQEEFNNVISLYTDLDITQGVFPPVKALRIIRPAIKLAKTDSLKLVEFYNANLPPNSSKQYKLYLNDDEVKSTDSTGTTRYERVFNVNGDLYGRADLEGSTEGPSAIIPETPTTPTEPTPERPPDRPTIPPDTIPETPETTPPTSRPITDERRRVLENYRNSLYYVGRVDIDNKIDILNQEIETALTDSNAYTTMDLTAGNVALAVAVKKSSTKNPRDIQSVYFEEIPPVQLSPGDRGFYLFIDGERINSPLTSTGKIFNRFGGSYINTDINGFDPILSYPYRPGSSRTELSKPENSTESSNPTGKSEDERREEQDLAFVRTGSGGIPLITRKDIDALSGALSSGWESFQNLVENSEEYKRQQREAPTSPFIDKFGVIRQP